MLDGMMKKDSLNMLLALYVFASMFAAGPAHAGYMDFTVESLQTEDAGGC